MADGTKGTWLCTDCDYENTCWCMICHNCDDVLAYDYDEEDYE